MSDLSKEPTNRELLERIVALEGDNARLRVQCDDLLEGFKSHVDGNVHMFDQISDLLWAVAHKVFPHLGGMLGKMNAVVPPSWANPSVDRRPREYKRD